MAEVKALLRNAPFSDQKGRLIADLIRGRSVSKALDILRFSRKRAAWFIQKALNSAISNAEENNQLDVDDLYVSRIEVNKGNNMKRFHTRARGRSSAIIKHRCHIAVAVSPKRQHQTGKDE